jgi:UPF0755 protein
MRRRLVNFTEKRRAVTMPRRLIPNFAPQLSATMDKTNFHILCRNKRFIIGGVVVLALLLTGALAVWSLLGGHFHPEEETYLYIDRDDTRDSVLHKLELCGGASRLTTLSQLMKMKGYTPKTGRYAIEAGESNLHFFRKIAAGRQTPLMLSVGNPRTVFDLARSLGAQLETDSAEIAALMTDSAYIDSLGGYTLQTLPAFFVPNSYEVYWDIRPKALFSRLKREHDAFWDAKDRREDAARMGLSPVEVATLASIVDAETNYTPEKPRVAGLYLNRLHQGMKLQSDPTVVFSAGDFSIRRVGHKHLQTDSPYNTYLYEGLPPGPIRIASIAGIDAVLHAEQHDYLYMCAREDFSGSHRFAATWGEHQRNARLYQQALNRRNIRVK